MGTVTVSIFKTSKKLCSSIQVGLTITKAMITIPVAISGLIGALLAEPNFGLIHTKTMLAIWLMASASSCINQVQERKYDALMCRTKKRPLVQNKISLMNSILLIVILALGSLWTIRHQLNFVSFGLLIGTAIWYNAVYTPLKRKTPFAVIPGAITGMTPPIIGYTLLQDGAIEYGPIVFLSVFFFLGQIPHFWILLVRYQKDYKKAGFAVLTDYISDKQLKHITITWGTVAFVSAFLLFQSDIFFAKRLEIYVPIVTFMLAMLFILNHNQNKRQFIILNSLYLLVMVSILLDRILF